MYQLSLCPSSSLAGHTDSLLQHFVGGVLTNETHRAQGSQNVPFLVGENEGKERLLSLWP